MFEKLKWTRIGYTDGRVKVNDTVYTARAIMYIRPPFLWFKTRKVEYIGDYNLIIRSIGTSEHFRKFDLSVGYWLRGGKIDYVSDSGNGSPGEIIRLVKSDC